MNLNYSTQRIAVSLAILILSVSAELHAQGLRATKVQDAVDKRYVRVPGSVAPSLHVSQTNQIDAIPPEIKARFSPDVVAKLPAVVWKRIVAQRIDPATLENSQDQGQQEECPPLDFSIRFSEAQGAVHKANHCGFWGG